MSDFDQLRAVCPALAQAGIEAAQIAEKDIQQALEKLSAISTSLIRMMFEFRNSAGFPAPPLLQSVPSEKPTKHNRHCQ